MPTDSPEAGAVDAHVDHRLLPASLQEQPRGDEHEELAHDQAGLLAEQRQPLDQRIDAEVPVLAQRDDRAEEGELDEQPARHLLGDRDAEC